MQTRSIFSNNTFKTTFNSANTFQNTHHHSFHTQYNHLHQYLFEYLAPNSFKQYPYLTKMIYLQFLLKQNLLIYTQDRITVRQIVSQIMMNMEQSISDNILIIDESSSISRLIKSSKNQNSIFILYDVHKLNTQCINALINYTNSNENSQENKKADFSFIGISSSKQHISPHILDLFSLMIYYQPQPSMIKLFQNSEEKSKSLSISSSKKLSKGQFNQWLKQNYETVILCHQQEGFIKPFFIYLQACIKFYAKDLFIPQFKWKKALKLLKFIGVNRSIAHFKKMGLCDMLYLPQTLVITIKEYEKMRQILKIALSDFIPFYGREKFYKSVDTHFWLDQKVKQEYQHLINQEKIRSSISFFYPCNKFPETAMISCNHQNSQKNLLEYAIVGQQKKLMSDHHYQIQKVQNYMHQYQNKVVKTNKKYILSASVCSKYEMKVHIGISCYDSLKNVIHPIQVCRIEGSQVLFNRIQQNWLYVENIQNSGLNKWKGSQDFQYQKAIGVYPRNHSHPFLKKQNILYNKISPFSKNKIDATTYVEIDLENNRILLAQQAKQWLVKLVQIQGPELVLMNHFQGGNYCVGRTIQIKKELQNSEKIGENIIEKQANLWHSIEMQYCDFKYQNNGNNFLPGTQYIRVAVIYEAQKVNLQQNQNTAFLFKNVSWKQVK